MKRNKRKFVICVRNDGAEDLEISKVYRILPDARAAKDRYVRIIDESGEDYQVMHGLMRRGWRLSHGVASEALSDERDSQRIGHAYGPQRQSFTLLS